MRRVSSAYKVAMAKHLRDHTYMVCSLGVVSNEAQGSARVISPMHYLSNNVTLFKERTEVGEYATFEEMTVQADGKTYFPPRNDDYIQLLPNMSALSREIMGSIKIQFDNAYDIKGLTIGFGQNHPTSFNIIINDETTHSYTNDSETFETLDNFNGTQSITIQPVSFNDSDNKRLRIESMLMGVGLIFRSEDIINASLSDSASFVCAELPRVSFDITVSDKNDWFNVDNDASFMRYLQTGQRLNLSIGTELEDKSIEWLQMPPTYLVNWSSDSNKTAKFTGADKLNVFLAEKYESGYYIHSRTAYDEAHAVCVSAGLEPDEYIIDDILRAIPLVNPMPMVGHSEALQLIANAARCSLKEDSAGRVIIIPNFENIVEPLDLVVNTTSEAAWSKPSNIRTGAEMVYADFTRNCVPADGTMYFIPHSGEGYLESGFVTSEAADANGEFTTTPSLEVVLPSKCTYFGLDFDFAGNPPVQFTIKVYSEQILVDTVVVDNPTKEHRVFHDFLNFDKLVLEFNKAMPYNRVIVQRVGFGDITDYKLTLADIKKSTGTVETKVRDVRVRVFTFEEEETEVDGETVMTPHQVDDSVYYTKHVNNVGEVITFENPLISTMEHARQVAEWLANYYANDITYSVDYRGDARIESSDYIYMESEVVNNLQVEVDTHDLRYNGALSGTLKLRRAINML